MRRTRVVHTLTRPPGLWVRVASLRSRLTVASFSVARRAMTGSIHAYTARWKRGSVQQRPHSIPWASVRRTRDFDIRKAVITAALWGDPAVNGGAVHAPIRHCARAIRRDAGVDAGSASCQPKLAAGSSMGHILEILVPAHGPSLHRGGGLEICYEASRFSQASESSCSFTLHHHPFIHYNRTPWTMATLGY
mmetsp:Transcript_24166/g.73913  ORF Transcript_24166/g.73913 Transcript_24166/m.73913 type:complete len:192 (-) Transcript_24166:114-689(-)